MPKYSEDQKAAKMLADALTELPDNWIVCRDVRHAWAVDEDFHVTGNIGGKAHEIRRTLVCMRCGSHRNEVYLQTKFGLDKTRQSYAYEEGYQIKGVPRGVKPSSIVQGEQYRRAMERIAGAKKSA